MIDCYFKDRYKRNIDCEQVAVKYFIYIPPSRAEAKVLAFCQKHTNLFKNYPESYQEITEDKYCELKLLT